MRGLLADFHIQSSLSDGDCSLREIVDIFGKGGVEVLNFSDHIYDTLSERSKNAYKKDGALLDWDEYSHEVAQAQRYAQKRYGMLVVQGAEITNYDTGFHILAVDIREPIDPNLSAERVIDAIHKQGGLAISAHPYDKPDAYDRGYVFHCWEHRDTFAPLMDLWEIGNGNVLYEEVPRENLRFVANSDFHHRDQFPSWKTLVHARKNIEAVKKALLAQDISIIKVQH